MAKKFSNIAKKLSRMEQMALDGFILHSEEDGAMEICYQMAHQGIIDEYTPKAKIQNDALHWFSKSEVSSYVDMRSQQLKEMYAPKGDGHTIEVESVEAKDYLTIIKELERDRTEARQNGDMDNYQKFSKLLLDYMKSSKEDVGDEDNRVHTYVPLVCVDNCPLYAEKLSEIRNRTNEQYNEFFD